MPNTLSNCRVISKVDLPTAQPISKARLGSELYKQRQKTDKLGRTGQKQRMSHSTSLAVGPQESKDSRAKILEPQAVCWNARRITLQIKLVQTGKQNRIWTFDIFSCLFGDCLCMITFSRTLFFRSTGIYIFSCFPKHLHLIIYFICQGAPIQHLHLLTDFWSALCTDPHISWESRSHLWVHHFATELHQGSRSETANTHSVIFVFRTRLLSDFFVADAKASRWKRQQHHQSKHLWE